jgi:hypothetical protein
MIHLCARTLRVGFVRIEAVISRRALIGCTVTAVALAFLFVASSRDVWETGFLLYFRDEGRGVSTEGTLLLVLFCLAIVLVAGAYVDARNQGAGVMANLAIKVSLAAAVAFMLAFPDLPQFENKSLTMRAILYPILAASFAAWWLVAARPRPYPSLVDLSWTLVLAIDIVGNNLHWYGNWSPWDDVVHFTSSVPAMFIIMAGMLVWLGHRAPRLGFGTAALFSFAIYISLHAFWEMAEFMSDRIAGTELQPGGMAEATANSLSAVAGSLVGLALLYGWHSSGTLVPAFVAPLSALAGLERPNQGEPDQLHISAHARR